MSPRHSSRTWRGVAPLSSMLIYLLFLCIAAPQVAADVPHVPVCAQNAISLFMVQNNCETDYKCLCSPGLRPQLDGNIGQTCQSVDHQVALQGIEMDCSTWLTSTATSQTTSTSAGAVPTTLQTMTAAAATTSMATRSKAGAGAAPTNLNSEMEKGDGIPDTVKIGVGVGLGMSLPLLAVIGYLVYRIREQRMAHAIELAKLKGWEPGVAL